MRLLQHVGSGPDQASFEKMGRGVGFPMTKVPTISLSEYETP